MLASLRAIAIESKVEESVTDGRSGELSEPISGPGIPAAFRPGELPFLPPSHFRSSVPQIRFYCPLGVNTFLFVTMAGVCHSFQAPMERLALPQLEFLR